MRHRLKYYDADVLSLLWGDIGVDKAIVHIGTGLYELEKTGLLETLHLSNISELGAFLGHMRVETGYDFATEENLNYQCKKLGNTFKFYRDRNGKKLARIHGKCNGHNANQRDIANHAYACKNGNGSIASGDGWKYKAGGTLGLTGKRNYLKYDRFLEVFFPNLSGIMPEGFETVSTYPHSFLSAAYYWSASGMWKAIDPTKNIITVKQNNKVTQRINPYTSVESTKARLKYGNEAIKIIKLIY